MDELTSLIKKNIKSKYSSTRRFAEELCIPQTTIVSAIKNGISGTAFTTVCKMCNALDIKLMNGIYPVVVTDTTKNLIEKMSKLDEKGIHTVTTVLEMEYLRCKAESEIKSAAEKNSKTDAINSYPVISEEEITSVTEVNDLLQALVREEDLLK